MLVIFEPDAEAELAEARTWCGLQRNGLDRQLIQRIEETLQRIIDGTLLLPYRISKTSARSSEAVSIHHSL
jgi:hypothetical protein